MVGGWRLAGTGIGLKDKHGGEAGEQSMVFWQGGLMTEESRSGGPKPRRSVTTVTGGVVSLWRFT